MNRDFSPLNLRLFEPDRVGLRMVRRRSLHFQILEHRQRTGNPIIMKSLDVSCFQVAFLPCFEAAV